MNSPFIQNQNQNQNQKIEITLCEKNTVLLGLTGEQQKDRKTLSEFSKISGTIYPHILVENRENTNEPAIKSISWHKYQQKFAVLLGDDQVAIFDLLQQNWENLQLSNPEQTNSTCIKYRPLSGDSFAVGNANGNVIVWRIKHSLIFGESQEEMDFIDENQESIEPFNSQSKMRNEQKISHLMEQESKEGVIMCILKHKKPVKMISWADNGRLIAVASDSFIFIWDIFTQKQTELKRPSSFKTSIDSVEWSPSGLYLIAIMNKTQLVIYETQNWNSQILKYDLKIGSICWNSNDDMLCLSFKNHVEIDFVRFMNTYSESKPSFDINVSSENLNEIVENHFRSFRNLSHQEIIDQDNQDEYSIKKMALDPSGKRLAIIFSDSSPLNKLICLLSVQQLKIPYSIQLSFIGYIHGSPECGKPQILSFSPNFTKGALLCCVWENGRIQLLPLYFKNDFN
ncbi:aladin WD repeat nucleoporin [Anaeramoeba ignava]|uniref:Aladin WD repeat nucleoporin n=1 Tax=Anaeramoeba ignava TaxID=1746090 RepID=A0A9Q0LLG6_ANAIG|nr:aladin WD repeat nucleoporin [Anaeramoeba ignava]